MTFTITQRDIEFFLVGALVAVAVAAHVGGEFWRMLPGLGVALVISVVIRILNSK